MRTTFSQNLISQLTKGTSSITTVHSIYLIGAKKVNTSYGYTTFDSEEEIIPELNCYSLSVVIITYGKFSVSKEFMNLIYTKMQEKVQVCPSTIAVPRFLGLSDQYFFCTRMPVTSIWVLPLERK